MKQNTLGQWVGPLRCQPFLVGGNQSRADEDELLALISQQAFLIQNAYNTVQTKLMGIRHAHLSAGLYDPLMGKERVWMLLRGLKRLAPTTALAGLRRPTALVLSLQMGAMRCLLPARLKALQARCSRISVH